MCTDNQVNVITHTFNVLISPRTFLNLIVTADHPSSSESESDTPSGFITVQVPLNFDPKHSIPDALRDRIIQSAPKNTIFAAYASVEQIRLDSDDVEWTMATTSDAGGAPGDLGEWQGVERPGIEGELAEHRLAFVASFRFARSRAFAGHLLEIEMKIKIDK